MGIRPLKAFAWGANFSGQLGDGTNTSSNVPVSVSGLTNVIAIAAGSAHSRLLFDRTVQAWGDNQFGQLGDGTNTSSNVPVSVSGLTNVIAIAAGSFHSLALLSDGTIQAWGANGAGN